jgi:hypothetical protein
MQSGLLLLLPLLVSFLWYCCCFCCSDFAARMQSVRCTPLPEELYSAFGVKPTRRSGRVRNQPIVYQAVAIRWVLW